MTRKTPLWRLLAAAGAASLVLAACGGDDDDGEGTEPEATGEATDEGEAPMFEGQLHLGTLLPQTGSLAFLGPPEFAGVDLAVLDINEAGGVGGSEVTVSHTDSGGRSGSAMRDISSWTARRPRSATGWTMAFRYSRDRYRAPSSWSRTGVGLLIFPRTETPCGTRPGPGHRRQTGFQWRRTASSTWPR